MARIASVSVCNVCVPLDRVTSFATRTVRVRHYCLVKVRSSDGAEGLGYCYAGSSAGNIVYNAVQELLAPMLIREDSTRVEGLWEEMYREALLQGRTGSVMRALSALDIALWDLTPARPVCLYSRIWAAGLEIASRHTPAAGTISMVKLHSISARNLPRTCSKDFARSR